MPCHALLSNHIAIPSKPVEKEDIRALFTGFPSSPSSYRTHSYSSSSSSSFHHLQAGSFHLLGEGRKQSVVLVSKRSACNRMFLPSAETYLMRLGLGLLRV